MCTFTRYEYIQKRHNLKLLLQYKNNLKLTLKFTNKMKKVYEAPSFEVVEVKVEKGFASSNGTLEQPRSGEGIVW